MNTYHIPIEGRTVAEYFAYVNTLPITFFDKFELDINPATNTVRLNGTIAGATLIANPLPPPTPSIAKLDFMRRFTNAELAGILVTAQSVPLIAVYIKKLDAAISISLEDPDTIAGVQALESGGLLAAGRAVEILTP